MSKRLKQALERWELEQELDLALELWELEWKLEPHVYCSGLERRERWEKERWKLERRRPVRLFVPG